MKRFLALALGSAFFSNSISAGCLNQDPAFHIPKTNKEIKVDADLSDPAWLQAHRVEMNNVTWPDENVPAPVRTEAFIIEDGDTLYVAFKAYDPNPEEIRAFLTDRDSNWGDDRVGIKIDTYNDSALAYQFFINPLGTQTDAIENELTKNEYDSWDVIWDSAGKITDFGYVVEIAIPLRALNFNDDLDVQSWGMELVRFYPRNQEVRISNTNIDHDNACWICQMVTVTGFEGAKQGHNLTVVPTIVSGTSEERDLPDNREWQEERNTDIGLDVKWGITPDITLDATINPDFSQVEADSGQLNVNTTFALFTEEKRSFFLSNRDYFDTPVDLIYTRNINDPDYGAKVTGKLGSHSFGAFVANDASTTFLMPGNLGSNIFEVDEKSVNGAFRYRYAVNDELAFGTTTTVRDSDSYHNYLYSFDSKYKPTENDTFDFQFMSSDTEMTDELIAALKVDASNEQKLRVESVNTTDQSYRLSYRHENRDWFFKASHNNIGEDFRADLAFYNNADHTKNVIGGGYTWRGDSSTWYNRYELEGDWDRTTAQDGEQIEQEGEMFLTIWGPKLALIRHGIVVRDRVAGRIDDSLLTLKNNSVSFTEREFHSWSHFKPTTNIWTGLFVRIGENIDYDNQQLADSLRIEPHLDWNFGKHLKADLTYRYRNLSKQGGGNLLTARLADVRFTYQFSIRSFLRFSAVYQNIDRNLSNYNEDIRDDYNSNYKSIDAQLLYSYKLNPQTLLFLGYSTGGYEDDELDEITQDTRSVFLKLSYAWLL